jgi:Na+/alanine symporter
MNTNEIFPIVLLLCVLSALVFLRKILSAPNASVNVNEIPPKANPRMNRIQRVSKGIRLFLLYGIPICIVCSLASIFFIPKSWAENQLHTPDGTTFTSAYQAHRTGIALNGVLLLVLFLFWYRTALKLFSNFEKGNLFTAETVRCIQILGGIYVVRFLLYAVFNFLLLGIQGLVMDLNDLFMGLLVIFIGWLIDEARKIREEQELTV